MDNYQEEWTKKGIVDFYAGFQRHNSHQEVDVIVDEIIARNLQDIDGLDIGGGGGDASLLLLGRLQASGIKVVSWDVIDISPAQIDLFQERSAGISYPEFNFIVADWANYEVEKQYHFILAMHSWYGLGATGLEKMYAALAPNGLAVIVVSSHENVLCSISNRLRNNDKFRVGGKQICQALAEAGIPFAWEQKKMTLPALLEGGELTEAGEAIYRFLLNCWDLSAVRQDLVKHLKRWFEKNREWFSEVDFIWIQK